MAVLRPIGVQRRAVPTAKLGHGEPMLVQQTDGLLVHSLDSIITTPPLVNAVEHRSKHDASIIGNEGGAYRTVPYRTVYNYVEGWRGGGGRGKRVQ